MEFPNPKFPGSADQGRNEPDQKQYDLDKVYRMSFNESALGPSPHVVAAIAAEAVNLGDYPHMTDITLRKALATTWGRGLEPDNFFTGCSGYEVIELVIRAILRSGDEMIICHPAFDVYNKLVSVQGGKAIDVPLLSPDFKIDSEAIIDACNDRTCIVLLCNPNSPTGTITPSAEMDHIINNLPKNAVLIIDEVYFHFVEDDIDYPDSVEYIVEGRPVVATHSFSKAYGLAGLRLGYAIAPKPISDYIAGIQRGFHQSRLALVAGVTALRDQAHLRANVRIAQVGKHWLYAEFERLGLDYVPSQTNFVVVFLPATHDNQQVVEQLYKHGVMVSGLSLNGFNNALRVSVNVPEANIRFIKGLEAILAS